MNSREHVEINRTTGLAVKALAIVFSLFMTVSGISLAVFISYGAGPHSQAINGNMASSGNSVFDPGSSIGTFVKNIPVGIEPLQSAYDSSNGYIYVPDANSHNISVIDGSTNRVIDSIYIGQRIWTATYDNLNGYIYVSVGDNTVNYVCVVNGATNQLIQNITVGGYQPNAMAFDPNNGYLYVTNSLSNSVSVINGNTDTTIATIAVGSFPDSAVYDASNNNIYVGNQYSSTVSVISDSTNAVLDTFSVGSNPYGMAYDTLNQYIYVSDYYGNTVSVIQGSTNSVISTIGVGTGPNWLSFDQANGFIYVCNYDSAGGVVAIDGANNSVMGTIATDPYAGGISFDGSNGNLYVSCGMDTTLASLGYVTVLKVSSGGGTLTTITPPASGPLSELIYAIIGIVFVIIIPIVIIVVIARAVSRRRKRRKAETQQKPQGSAVQTSLGGMPGTAGPSGPPVQPAAQPAAQPNAPPAAPVPSPPPAAAPRPKEPVQPVSYGKKGGNSIGLLGSVATGKSTMLAYFIHFLKNTTAPLNVQYEVEAGQVFFQQFLDDILKNRRFPSATGIESPNQMLIKFYSAGRLREKEVYLEVNDVAGELFSRTSSNVQRRRNAFMYLSGCFAYMFVIDCSTYKDWTSEDLRFASILGDLYKSKGEKKNLRTPIVFLFTKSDMLPDAVFDYSPTDLLESLPNTMTYVRSHFEDYSAFKLYIKTERNAEGEIVPVIDVLAGGRVDILYDPLKNAGFQQLTEWICTKGGLV